MTLKITALNCTLKTGKKESSTERLLNEILTEFSNHNADGEIIRITKLNIKPGVTSDEGDGDDWPEVRKKILDSDILLIGTPIWLGQPSSVCHRVLERMDAFLEETDEKGRMVSYGKVACVAVVGNEDGAHHVSAELYQALNDIGFTLPANAVSYWVGEAMGSTNYKDLKTTPDNVANATSMMVRNTVHLADLLKKNQYPGK